MFNNFSQNQSFGNYLPYNSYTASLYQQNQQYQNNISQPDTNITFVNGMEGAKAFQMRPNQSVMLMDSDSSKFYVKSTDNLGIAKISSYTFVEDDISNGMKQSSEVSANSAEQNKELYSSLYEKVNELESKVSELSSKLNEVL